MKKEPKVIGKCHYCEDPIYDFQGVSESGKSHKGCFNIFNNGSETPACATCPNPYLEKTLAKELE